MVGGEQDPDSPGTPQGDPETEPEEYIEPDSGSETEVEDEENGGEPEPEQAA